MTRCYECKNYNHHDCRDGKFDRKGRVQNCNCSTCLFRFKKRRVRIGQKK